MQLEKYISIVDKNLVKKQKLDFKAKIDAKTLKSQLLSMKTVTNEKFEYFQFKMFIFY